MNMAVASYSSVGLIAAYFSAIFEASPLVVRSPGRINLLGEHTGYHGGFALPAAVDAAIYCALAPNNTGDRCRVYAKDVAQYVEFTIGEWPKNARRWEKYLYGVVAELMVAGYQVGGFDLVFGGNVPIGVGMSSSAAIECGLIYGLCAINNLPLDRLQMARLVQRVEHQHADVQSSLTDAFANLMSRTDAVLQLDCRSLDYAYFPLALGEYRLILLDTQVKYALADHEYHLRMNQCREGLARLQKVFPQVRQLRDVTMDMLDQCRGQLHPVALRRCKYVIAENERVLAACACLLQGNLPGFGRLLFDTHQGLRHEYEISCPELDFLVDFAAQYEGVLGARMMGGGFGGCALHLIHRDVLADFSEAISRRYLKANGRQLHLYPVRQAEGTGLIALPDNVAFNNSILS